MRSRRASMTRRRAGKPDHLGRSRARAELSDGEKREEEESRRQQKAHRRGGDPERAAAGKRRDRRLLRGEAGVELVNEGLLLETEKVCVAAEERLCIGSPRENVEPLLFERSEVLGSDLRGGLGVSQLETSANPGLTQAIADLQHGSSLSELKSTREFAEPEPVGTQRVRVSGGRSVERPAGGRDRRAVRGGCRWLLLGVRLAAPFAACAGLARARPRQR
jgi:hypothetical protein